MYYVEDGDTSYICADTATLVMCLVCRKDLTIDPVIRTGGFTTKRAEVFKVPDEKRAHVERFRDGLLKWAEQMTEVLEKGSEQ